MTDIAIGHLAPKNSQVETTPRALNVNRRDAEAKACPQKGFEVRWVSTRTYADIYTPYIIGADIRSLGVRSNASFSTRSYIAGRRYVPCEPASSPVDSNYPLLLGTKIVLQEKWFE